MKKGNYIKCLCILVILLSWCPAHADFINVVYLEYKIKGEGHFYGSPPFPPPQSFDITSAAPISAGISDQINSLNNAGGYWARAASDGGVTGTYAWTHIYVDATDAGDAYSTASASASLIFSPILSSAMRLVIDGTFSQNYLHLLDLTLNNTSLLPSTGDPFWDTHGSKSLTLLFDPTHTYEMSIQIENVNFLSREYTVFLIPVPEPTTILLLGLGLIGLRCVLIDKSLRV